jgi:hypothetical protein
MVSLRAAIDREYPGLSDLPARAAFSQWVDQQFPVNQPPSAQQSNSGTPFLKQPTSQPKETTNDPPL